MTGLLQFITPTLQFIIGVAVRHEVVSAGRWVGFIAIWFALVALGTDLIQTSRTPSLK
jgi:chloramphenicol-sensitive protein RarD